MTEMVDDCVWQKSEEEKASRRLTIFNCDEELILKEALDYFNVICVYLSLMHVLYNGRHLHIPPLFSPKNHFLLLYVCLICI